MPPEIRQIRRNATGSRRRAVKLAGSTGTPTPKEKRQQQPLNGQRDGRSHRQTPTRARALIPRPVVFSTIQDHQETVRSASPSPGLRQIGPACQAIPRADQPPAADSSGSHSTPEGRGRERSHPARHVQPGTTDSGGGSRQTSGQRQAVSGRKMAFCKTSCKLGGVSLQ